MLYNAGYITKEENVMEIDTSEYQGIMHMVADKLIQSFEGSEAVNYIEQTFEDKENPERSFVLTMQMVEGLTPCQKLAKAEDRIKHLEDELLSKQTKEEKTKQ